MGAIFTHEPDPEFYLKWGNRTESIPYPEDPHQLECVAAFINQHLRATSELMFESFEHWMFPKKWPTDVLWQLTMDGQTVTNGSLRAALSRCSEDRPLCLRTVRQPAARDRRHSF